MTTGRPAIVAAVIVHDRQVLLVRRRINEVGLSWQFPAGEQDRGEDPHDTARREATEEVGLAVYPVATIGERTHPATARHMIYVECIASDAAATLVDTEELVELAWCDWSGLIARIPNGLFPPVAKHLRSFLLA